MEGEQKMLAHTDLNQFVGDLERWRHQLCPSLLYTPGIKYLCENGGDGDNTAWWLLDAIASYQSNLCINSNGDLRSLQFWKLKVEGSKAVLTCEDGNNNIFITQRIEYTDFCLDEISVWVGCNGDGTRTAYLPSEH